MPRSPSIRYEDVARAATRLIGRGERVTIDALYSALGQRGSRTTIHKHYRAFMDEFTSKGIEILPSSIPPAIASLMEDFWANALLEAGQGFEQERNEAQAQVEAIQRDFQNCQERIQQAERLLDERESLLTQKSQELENRNARISDLVASVESLRMELRYAQQEKIAIQGRLDDERKHWSERYDTALKEAAAYREQLEADLKMFRDQTEEDKVKYEELVDHWMRQLDDARQHISDLKIRHHDDLERLKGEVILERKRADRFAQNQSSLEERIGELEHENERLAKSNSGDAGHEQPASARASRHRWMPRDRAGQGVVRGRRLPGKR